LHLHRDVSFVQEFLTRPKLFVTAMNAITRSASAALDAQIKSISITRIDQLMDYLFVLRVQTQNSNFVDDVDSKYQMLQHNS
jgi:hypothetical protein